MCNAFNGIAIVLCFRGISIVTGFSEADLAGHHHAGYYHINLVQR